MATQVIKGVQVRGAWRNAAGKRRGWLRARQALKHECSSHQTVLLAKSSTSTLKQAPMLDMQQCLRHTPEGMHW